MGIKITSVWIGLILVTFGINTSKAFANTDYTNQEMIVPPEYQGFGLRIGGRHYDLRLPTLKVLVPKTKQRIELSDASNRLLANSFAKVGPNTLTSIRVRPFQVGVEVGGGHEAGTRTFKKLNLNGPIFHSGANFIYRPEAYGLQLNYNHHLLADNRFTVGPKSVLLSDRFGVAAVYEWAPLGEGAAFVARMHLAVLLGVVWARHNFEVTEDDVEVSDAASSIGPQSAIELRIPLAANLWLGLRGAYSSYRLKFSKLKFENSVQELNSSIGVRYAL